MSQSSVPNLQQPDLENGTFVVPKIADGKPPETALGASFQIWFDIASIAAFDDGLKDYRGP